MAWMAWSFHSIGTSAPTALASRTLPMPVRGKDYANGDGGPSRLPASVRIVRPILRSLPGPAVAVGRHSGGQGLFKGTMDILESNALHDRADLRLSPFASRWPFLSRQWPRGYARSPRPWSRCSARATRFGATASVTSALTRRSCGRWNRGRRRRYSPPCPSKERQARRRASRHPFRRSPARCGPTLRGRCAAILAI